MNLYNDIYQLLAENDCVIIPRFGGFIANYFEAKVNLENQEFTPPSRKIAFNESLQNNDGLLFNHICKTRDIPWDSADNYVRRFVSDINNRLYNGENVKFDKLGYFTRKDNILIFVPENNLNLLEDSFGFSSFNFPLLQSAKQIKEPQLKKNKTNEASIQLKASKKSRKALLSSFSIAAAVGGLIFMSLYLDFFEFNNSKNINYSNVVPVEIIKQTSTSKTENIEIPVVEVKTEIAEKPVINTIEEKIISNNNITETVKAINTLPEQKVSAYIIAGCFSSEVNAQNLNYELQKSGFPSVILPIYNGLYRVAVKSYSSKRSAIDELNDIKYQLNNYGLWILDI